MKNMRCYIFCLLIILFPLITASQSEESINVFLFNPEGRMAQGQAAQRELEAYLASSGFRARVFVFASTKDIDIAVNRLQPSFALVPSYYYTVMKKTFKWREILAGYNNESSGFQKILVTPHSILNPSMLKGEGIATVSMGAATIDFLNSQFLEPIGLLNKDVRIVTVSKDIDGIMALGFGQVKGAIVTKSSFDLLKKINPGAVGNLKILKKLPIIPYPRIVAFPSARNIERFKTAMQNIDNSGSTGNVMRFMNITKFR